MRHIIEVMEEKLGKTFSISTVQKDIKTMKEDEALAYRAPIAYSRLHDGYYYSDPNYTIASIPLSEEDVNAIDFAAEVLQQFRDIPIFTKYSDAVGKILEAVNLSKEFDDSVEEVIQFEQSPSRLGSEWIGPVLRAIRARKAVQFTYKKFGNEEEKQHIVNPYLLKEYRNRWYVIGRHRSRDRVMIFGLDRITTLANTEETWKPDRGFDPKEYFKYSFGITTYDGKPEEVVLSFKPEESPYLKSQPLHHSQQVLVDNNKEFRISLTVYPTKELKMAIWSFGPNVKVVKPKGLLGS